MGFTVTEGLRGGRVRAANAALLECKGLGPVPLKIKTRHTHWRRRRRRGGGLNNFPAQERTLIFLGGGTKKITR